MFKVDDYVVCPGHGVGQITAVEGRSVEGEDKSFYVIKILTGGMTIMVPTSGDRGIRELMHPEKIKEVFELLENHKVSLDTSTWNRRYRDYMSKIKTGSLLEIADVLRTLFLLRGTKNLSFGEEKMLNYCRELLIQEISLSRGENKTDIKERIDSCFVV